MAAAICANLLHAGYNISLTKVDISAWGKDRKEPLKTTKATEEGIDMKEPLKTTKATEEGIDRKEPLKTTKATEEGIQQDCLYQSERRMMEKAKGRRPGGREVKSWQWLATKGF